MSFKPNLSAFVVLAAVGASCAGCGNKAIATREQATAAALARYPGNPQQSEEIRLASIDHADDKKVEVANLTDRAIPTPMIWVNQTFVNKSRTIPPRGQVIVKYSELLEQGSGVRDLDMANVPVKTVEVQVGDELYTATGPSRK